MFSLGSLLLGTFYSEYVQAANVHSWRINLAWPHVFSGSHARWPRDVVPLCPHCPRIRHVFTARGESKKRHSQKIELYECDLSSVP